MVASVAGVLVSEHGFLPLIEQCLALDRSVLIAHGEPYRVVRVGVLNLDYPLCPRDQTFFVAGELDLTRGRCFARCGVRRDHHHR